ncbi:hypothetical protein DBIPINDM_001389 [Mesorhizobium sp. AR02]|uniref:DUF6894 family protein n=1 Tax=Mesorhizobium sp. AR02 TaxID=2865837 RepID=UPI00215E7555|nr:hypothetical protein [Mesorhizobium sp. AR02]UVK54912.1 hypothetical protein DBIPINDM_001389 [Mesorhizobium sp. AR02]
MEVVDTRVLQGQDAHLVEFQGEGGEQVRVTLAAGETARTDEQLVDAAKVVLVQIATFGSDTATPADNPEPVGQNYDAPVDADSYSLEYEDDGVVRQLPGIKLPHLGAVEAEVRRSAEDLWRDALDNNRAPTGWAVRARNAQGTIVASVDYSELQSASDDAIGG